MRSFPPETCRAKTGGSGYLALGQFTENPSHGHEFLIGATLNNFTGHHYIDSFGIHNCSKPMSDHDSRRTEASQAVAYDSLAFVIKRTGGLVEKDDSGLSSREEAPPGN